MVLLIVLTVIIVLLTGFNFYLYKRRPSSKFTQLPNGALIEEIEPVTFLTMPSPFTPKEDAGEILDKIQEKYPKESVDYYFVSMPDGKRKITAQFEDGGAVVAVGNSTRHAAEVLAYKLGVTL